MNMGMAVGSYVQRRWPDVSCISFPWRTLQSSRWALWLLAVFHLNSRADEKLNVFFFALIVLGLEYVDALGNLVWGLPSTWLEYTTSACFSLFQPYTHGIFRLCILISYAYHFLNYKGGSVFLLLACHLGRQFGDRRFGTMFPWVLKLVPYLANHLNRVQFVLGQPVQ